MSLPAALVSLADGLQLSQVSAGAPGEPVVAALSRPPLQLKTSEVVTSTVKLTWLTKQVSFPLPTFVAEMQKDQPSLATLDSLLSLPETGSGTVGGLTDTSAIQGTIGQLVSEVPTTVNVDLPVAIAVSWSVTNGNDEPLADDSFVQVENSTARGAFLFAPDVIAGTGGSPSPAQRKIKAAVTLTVEPPGGEPISETRTLELPVSVPSLAIPTVLALFNHAPFDLSVHGGIPPCILIVVPSNSPYRDLASLTNVLEPVGTALSSLAPVFSTLQLIGDTAATARAVTRLVGLLKAIADPTKGAIVIVRATQQELFLERIKFYTEFLYTHTAEDTFGSLFMLGGEGTTVHLFNARECDPREGALPVKIPTGSVAVVIDSLHGDPPAADPAHAIDTNGPRYKQSSEGSFGDRMSSFELALP
jgi:hypothetical protein